MVRGNTVNGKIIKNIAVKQTVKTNLLYFKSVFMCNSSGNVIVILIPDFQHIHIRLGLQHTY